MKQKCAFSVTITRIIEYDDENEKIKNLYRDNESDELTIEDMIDIDKEFANEDPIMFFIECDEVEWGDVKTSLMRWKRTTS